MSYEEICQAFRDVFAKDEAIMIVEGDNSMTVSLEGHFKFTVNSDCKLDMELISDKAKLMENDIRRIMGVD